MVIKGPQWTGVVSDNTKPAAGVLWALRAESGNQSLELSSLGLSAPQAQKSLKQGRNQIKIYYSL